MTTNNGKSGSGIRNVEDEEKIYPEGENVIHKTKEDIRPLNPSAKPDQEKKSDMHYVGESSKGVKKTNQAGGDPDEVNKEIIEPEAEEPELIEPRTWDSPQPEKDKNNPL